MSNIFQSENLDNDYTAFEIALFKTNELKFQLSEELKPILKKYHRYTYVVALYLSKLSEKWGADEHRFLYVNEILSDLLCNSSISIIGFYHSSQIIIRRFVENFYNHIYYFEHPVEYALLNMGRNEYTPMLDLKNYFEAHPIIVAHKDANVKLFNSTLFAHYQELCKTVHTKGNEFMGLAKNLEEIKPDVEISKHFEHVNKSAQNIIYLLYKFHTDLEFTNHERDIISKSFAKNIRSQLLA